jgi:very-short-patch-repair endonuclease
MKSKPTRYEVAFAKRLDEAGINYKAQMIFGFYILDFCLPDYLINIEIDGDIHNPDYDFRRDMFSNKSGLKVIRILNEDVHRFDLQNILNEPKHTLNDFCSCLAMANSLKGVIRSR